MSATEPTGPAANSTRRLSPGCARGSHPRGGRRGRSAGTSRDGRIGRWPAVPAGRRDYAAGFYRCPGGAAGGCLPMRHRHPGVTLRANRCAAPPNSRARLVSPKGPRGCDRDRLRRPHALGASNAHGTRFVTPLARTRGVRPGAAANRGLQRSSGGSASTSRRGGQPTTRPFQSVSRDRDPRPTRLGARFAVPASEGRIPLPRFAGDRTSWARLATENEGPREATKEDESPLPPPPTSLEGVTCSSRKRPSVTSHSVV
jgi:hypothetical protein